LPGQSENLGGYPAVIRQILIPIDFRIREAQFRIAGVRLGLESGDLESGEPFSYESSQCGIEHLASAPIDQSLGLG
jgi:hypothetical protein